jgi:hypothetical protein
MYVRLLDILKSPTNSRNVWRRDGSTSVPVLGGSALGICSEIWRRRRGTVGHSSFLHSTTRGRTRHIWKKLVASYFNALKGNLETPLFLGPMYTLKTYYRKHAKLWCRLQIHNAKIIHFKMAFILLKNGEMPVSITTVPGFRSCTHWFAIMYACRISAP